MTWLFCAVLMAAVVPLVGAQEPPQNTGQSDNQASNKPDQPDAIVEGRQLTAERITALRTTAEQDPSLTEDTKEEVLALYDEALTFLSVAADANRRRQQLIDLNQSAPQEVDRLNREIAQERDREPDTLEQLVNTNGVLALARVQTTVQQLESEYEAAGTSLREAEQRLSNVQSEPQDRAARRADYVKRSAELKGLLGEPANAQTSVARRQARQVNYHAEQIKLDAQLSMLEQERTTQDIRLTLRKAQLELAALIESRLSKSLEAWRQVLRLRQADETARVRSSLTMLRDQTANPLLIERITAIE
jgi:hypothetical protein